LKQCNQNGENLPLLVRISASDWAGGWNLEESIQLSKILKEKGDLIDVSSGGAVSHTNSVRSKLPSCF
jgi:2,4-dienoyl-CoA reductase-like NADH-dependent reductase (Old Yellow Enzyme family)